MATLLIAEPGSANAQRLAQTAVKGLDAEQAVEICGSLEMALDYAEQHVIDALVVGPSLVGDLAFELASYLTEANKGATVIVPEVLDTDVLRAAMRSSVADVIEFGKIEDEMPGLPPLPKARTERLLRRTFRALRLVPGLRFRTALSFTMFQFAEQVSVHAHGVAKDAVPRRASFVPRVWALHAIDEGRHLQFDRLLLDKLALSPVLRQLARVVAVPFCLMATLAVHRNEAWSARQLGVPVRLVDLLRLLRSPTSPFKQRVVALMREVAARPRAAE